MVLPPSEGGNVATPSEAPTSEPAHHLLLVAIPGVQQFVAESMSTADVWGASNIRSMLADAVADAIASRPGSDIVMPVRAGGGHRTAGTTNRLTALVPAEHCAEIRDSVQRVVAQTWGDLAKDTVATTLARVPVICVCAAEASDYSRQWETAQLRLVARRRLQDFPAYRAQGGQACVMCAREQGVVRPDGLGLGQVLCATCFAKRTFRQNEPRTFPSTSSIASVPFRQRVLQRWDEPDIRSHALQLAAAVGEVQCALAQAGSREPRVTDDAVPLLGLLAHAKDEAIPFIAFDGAWCFDESWDPALLALSRRVPPERLPPKHLQLGRSALADLVKACGAPTPYLAVVVADGDRMGRRLAGRPGELSPDWHKKVSRALDKAADEQTKIWEKAGGRAVYAGGDDLLAFAPLEPALAALSDARTKFQVSLAELLHDAGQTAVLSVMHRHEPLVSALDGARGFLATTKAIGHRRSFGVRCRRRGGVRASVITSWSQPGLPPGVSALKTLVDAFRGGRLAFSLVTDLATDLRCMEKLSRGDRLRYLRRLLARHSDEPATRAQCEEALSCWEDISSWIDAMSVARFLAAEGR